MGFMDRLLGKKEKPPVIKAGVIGEGILAERLAEAYRACHGIEFMGMEPVGSADDLIRTPGLQAVEVVAPAAGRAGIAAACIRAGLFTSMDPPHDLEALEELSSLSRSYNTALRFRLLPLYYPPYREVKRLVDEDHLGRPLTLKLMVRRGKGAELPEELDPGKWVMEHELGFLALSQWLMGPVEKVYARLNKKGANGAPASSMIMWKYVDLHQYGYLQMDFCPGLHVRSFTDPVHRFLELTSVGGLIMVTRGEGQLLRMPVLMVRGKSTTTSFEMIPEEWSEVYNNLARETRQIIIKKRPITGTAEVAMSTIRLVQAARTSAEKGDEVEIQ